MFSYSSYGDNFLIIQEVIGIKMGHFCKVVLTPSLKKGLYIVNISSSFLLYECDSNRCFSNGGGHCKVFLRAQLKSFFLRTY